MLLAASGASAAPVKVKISTPPGATLTPEPVATLTATRQQVGSGEAENALGHSLELDLAEEHVLNLEPGLWHMRLEADGLWAEPILLDVRNDGESTAAFELWPASTVKGSLAIPRGHDAPEALAASIATQEELGSSGFSPVSSVECPVDQGTWSCLLPARTLDLRLAAAGFVARYVWGVKPPAGGVLDLGEIELEPGASVMGWVLAETGSPVEDARVELRPRARRPINPAVEARIGAMRLSGATDERGFFQIGPLPPGEYAVEAKSPPFAPARSFVRVAEPAEQIVDPPLVLRLPQPVEIYVEPQLTPASAPWVIEVARLDDDSQTIAVFEDGVVSMGGWWRHDGVPPGRYRVSLGPESRQWWFSEEIEIEQASSPIYVEMPVVEVRGTVSLGDEPVEGELLFGAVALASDAEGRFEGFLPRPGSWRIKVSGSRPEVERSVEGIRVEPRPGKSYAELEIVLPDTRLEGKVVDRRRLPVEGAMVTAQSLDEIVPAVRVRTDPEGEFEVRALPEGLATVIAEADDGNERWYSPELEVNLEDGEAAKVQLVLRKEMRLRGRIVDGGRGVPGARIKAEASHIRGLPLFVEHSDAEGRFEVRLPGDTRDLTLSVGAAGFGFRLLRVQADPDQPLVVPLSPAAGTLVVETPELEHGAWDAPRIFILHQGAVESLGYLAAWARFQQEPRTEPGRLVIPSMAPGEYSACLIDYKHRFLAGNEGAGTCVHGFLADYGELSLTLPAAAE